MGMDFRALTKPANAKIALIKKKSVAIRVHDRLYIVAGLYATLFRGHHGAFQVGERQRLPSFLCQLHLQPAVTYVQVSSPACKFASLSCRLSP